MKFSLFAHMERLEAEADNQRLYEEFLELCRLADEAGFEAIWTGEHHGMNFTIAPNPFLNLVDLARRTKNVRLGTGTIVAPFWHPIKLAGEAAMTDILVEGRLDIGLARGAYSFEYARLGGGMDAWAAGQYLREMVPAIKGLWRGDYAHEGDCWSFPKTSATPKPRQQPHPPLWVAARDPNSHAFAVASGCNVQVTPLWQGDEEVESLMRRFEEACTAHPEVPRPKIMVLRHTYVGVDEADLERAAEELSRYYCYFGAWFKNERPVTQGSIEPLSEEERAAMEIYAPEKMRRQNVVGTAGEVVERLKRYEALGYDQYAFWIDSLMPFERKQASLQRFIDDVLPAFA
jgi:alkanesulfonate monooxygenase SsuD/methylene tetrahydromethanopterin reductase-like flavin-dependent oxidoreductase (luciferase family)